MCRHLNQKGMNKKDKEQIRKPVEDAGISLAQALDFTSEG